MAKEEIRQIKAFPDYYISNKGIVYTTRISPRYNPNGEMRVLRPRIRKGGYCYYGLYIGIGGLHNRRWKRGHRLVAEAFIGTIAPKMVVNHKNFIKTDNRVENLEIVTSKQNSQHYHSNKHKIKKYEMHN